MSQQEDKIFIDMTRISEIARQRDKLLIGLTFLNVMTSILVLIGNGAGDIRIIALGYLAAGVSLVEWYVKISIFVPTVIAGLNLIFALAIPSSVSDFSGDTARANVVASLGGAGVCAVALTRPWASRKIEQSLPRLKNVFWPQANKVKVRYSNWFRKGPLEFVLIACALGLAALVVLFYQPRFLPDDHLRTSFFLGIGAYAFVALAHRYSKRTADEVLKEDTRPPVLCLRCFSDQKHFDSTSAPGISAPTFEQSLSSLLSEFGSSITLSSPQRSAPPKGIVIDPVDDNEWKPQVSKDLDRAGLVVALIGSTTDGHGFRWELEELVRRQFQYRTIFIMPPHRDRSAQELWESLAEIFQSTALAQLRDFPCDDVVLVRLTLDNKLLVFVDRSPMKARSGIHALAVCKTISMS